jgi:calcium-dependent protein kinase
MCTLPCCFSVSSLERTTNPLTLTFLLYPRYILKEIIGQGTYGVVRKCMHRKTKKIFAVKSILKSKIQDVDVLRREIDILTEVDHPHIIHLEDVYEDANYLHLVTELCTGGELYDRVIEKAQSPEKHFSEMDAARIIRNILDAIRYIHDEKHIVHRDLKPENFLLLDKSDDAPVKIIDFGLSRRDDFGVMRSRVGKYL